jgi:hypothetical protein
VIESISRFITQKLKLKISDEAVNQLPKSVVREIRTPRSVGAGGGRPPSATRWACDETHGIYRYSGGIFFFSRPA